MRPSNPYIDTALSPEEIDRKLTAVYREDQPRVGYHDAEEGKLGMATTTRPMFASSPFTTHAAPARSVRHRALFAGQILLFAVVVAQFVFLYRNFALAAPCNNVIDTGVAGRQSVVSSATSSPPDYYQTMPELFPGPTPTGEPAFLAETNPAPFPSTSYIPNTPLETQVPVAGSPDDGNIFQLMGQLSHYFPNPSSFGVDEYSLPENASIVQLNMLSRHGARYPTVGSGAPALAALIQNYSTPAAGYTKASFTGDLSFLNTWTYKLGAEILVPVGHQELFESGVLHQYDYGHLYPNDGSKIIARSTTQDRMTQSAEYFLAGFFGLDWTSNATLLLMVENWGDVLNNTLAGYNNCNNSNNYRSFGGNNATKEWYNIYLANATTRLNSMSSGFTWTIADAYNAQSLCAYETVALGYSEFCGLFTYQEWEGYEYSVDLAFAGNDAFQSPTGRAVGIGYVQEILARLQHHVITEPTAQINLTLDDNPTTFPLYQSLNFDFSHDTNIMSVLTAFGLTQFAPVMPATHIPDNRSLIVSHITPFAARLDMEVIKTPSPLNGSRANSDSYEEGPPTTYIHFILNQRTIPLGLSLPACGLRDDGWCELTTFLDVQSTSLEEAMYDYSCNGDYPAVPYGTLTNGVPDVNKKFEAQ